MVGGGGGGGMEGLEGLSRDSAKGVGGGKKAGRFGQ